MIAAVLRCELHIPDAASLKQKRAAVRPALEGLRRLASISVAEVGHQDSWQRVTLAIAVVSRPEEIDRMVERIVGFLDQRPDMALVSSAVGFVDDEDLHDRFDVRLRYPGGPADAEREVADG